MRDVLSRRALTYLIAVTLGLSILSSNANTTFAEENPPGVPGAVINDCNDIPRKLSSVVPKPKINNRSIDWINSVVRCEVANGKVKIIAQSLTFTRQDLANLSGPYWEDTARYGYRPIYSNGQTEYRRGNLFKLSNGPGGGILNCWGDAAENKWLYGIGQPGIIDDPYAERREWRDCVAQIDTSNSNYMLWSVAFRYWLHFDVGATAPNECRITQNPLIPQAKAQSNLPCPPDLVVDLSRAFIVQKYSPSMGNFEKNFYLNEDLGVDLSNDTRELVIAGIFIKNIASGLGVAEESRLRVYFEFDLEGDLGILGGGSVGKVIDLPRIANGQEHRVNGVVELNQRHLGQLKALANKSTKVFLRDKSLSSQRIENNPSASIRFQVDYDNYVLESNENNNFANYNKVNWSAYALKASDSTGRPIENARIHIDYNFGDFPEDTYQTDSEGVAVAAPLRSAPSFTLRDGIDITLSVGRSNRENIIRYNNQSELLVPKRVAIGGNRVPNNLLIISPSLYDDTKPRRPNVVPTIGLSDEKEVLIEYDRIGSESSPQVFKPLGGVIAITVDPSNPIANVRFSPKQELLYQNGKKVPPQTELISEQTAGANTEVVKILMEPTVICEQIRIFLKLCYEKLPDKQNYRYIEGFIARARQAVDSMIRWNVSPLRIGMSNSLSRISLLDSSWFSDANGYYDAAEGEGGENIIVINAYDPIFGQRPEAADRFFLGTLTHELFHALDDQYSSDRLDTDFLSSSPRTSYSYSRSAFMTFRFDNYEKQKASRFIWNKIILANNGRDYEISYDYISLSSKLIFSVKLGATEILATERSIVCFEKSRIIESLSNASELERQYRAEHGAENSYLLEQATLIKNRLEGKMPGPQNSWQVIPEIEQWHRNCAIPIP